MKPLACTTGASPTAIPYRRLYVLQVQAGEPGDGAFVFYFSAATVDGAP